MTAGAWYVPLDDQHVISTKANGRIGQALVNEAQALGAHAILIGGEASNANDHIAEVERFKNNIHMHFYFMRPIYQLLKERLFCLSKVRLQ